MLNLARQLEEATESVLGQRIYAVEYRAMLEEFHKVAAEFDSQCREASQDPYVSLKLRAGCGELYTALKWLEEFCREAGLSALDQGLAACRRADYLLQEAAALHQRSNLSEPLPSALSRPVIVEPPLPEFQLRVTRQSGVSRALFICPRCGWEFSYVSEIEATDFLEVPLSDFTCPLCELVSDNTSNDALPLDDSPGSGSSR